MSKVLVLLILIKVAMSSNGLSAWGKFKAMFTCGDTSVSDMIELISRTDGAEANAVNSPMVEELIPEQSSKKKKKFMTRGLALSIGLGGIGLGLIGGGIAEFVKYNTEQNKLHNSTLILTDSDVQTTTLSNVTSTSNITKQTTGNTTITGNNTSTTPKALTPVTQQATDIINNRRLKHNSMHTSKHTLVMYIVTVVVLLVIVGIALQMTIAKPSKDLFIDMHEYYAGSMTANTAMSYQRSHLV